MGWDVSAGMRRGAKWGGSRRGEEMRDGVEERRD